MRAGGFEGGRPNAHAERPGPRWPQLRSGDRDVHLPPPPPAARLTRMKGNVIIIFETWINGLKKLKFDDYNEKIKIVDLHIIKSTKFKSPIIFCIIMIHRKYKFHGKIIKALLNVDNQQVVFAHVTDNIIEYDVLAYEKLNSDNSNDNNLHLNGNEYYYKTSKDERITNDNVGSSCTDSYQNMINCNLKYSDMIYLNQSS